MWTPTLRAPRAPLWRRAVATALRGASRVLDRMAMRLRGHAHEAAAPGHIEYHAEAGAPEGALYVDGVLLGYLRGVQRL